MKVSLVANEKRKVFQSNFQIFIALYYCIVANQVWTSQHEKGDWYLGYEGRFSGK